MSFADLELLRRGVRLEPLLQAICDFPDKQAAPVERVHRDRGLSYVAAPVLGRPDVAAAGNLIVLAAGETVAVDRVRPLLALFARRMFPIGEQSSRANVARPACNFALAAMLETLCEAGAPRPQTVSRRKPSLR
jgi:3-hydroxyisobutyrate dehydrogenase-like beta-hydroxyacid dehydrogenase